MADQHQPEQHGPADHDPGHREDPGRPGRGRRPRVLAAGLVAAGLLALVAAGSYRGSLGSGRGRPSYPADLIDSLLVLVFLAMVAGCLLAAVVLLPGHRFGGPRRRPVGSLGLLLPLALLLAVWLLRDLLGLDGLIQEDATTSSVAPSGTLQGGRRPPASGVLPTIVGVVAVAAMVAIVAAQLAADRRRRTPPRSPAERLVELLDDTLEDLERDPDPRRAVIAAWARMERGLAAAGLARQPAEAPFEYAARVLASALGPAGAASGSVHRLTDLFERAKFSRQPIGPADRDQAIAALRAVRRELAEAAEQAAQAERARAAAVDRAAGR